MTCCQNHSSPRRSERILLAAFAIAAAQLYAQDKPVDWRAFDPPPSPVLSPEEALASFRLPPGFRIELVAAEPLVEDPVTAVWDEHGRLWAAELRGYMHDAEGTDENAGLGRIVVLQDEDGDGKMDRSTVFLDGLVMPRSIAHVQGGVLIAEPPKIWFCQDTDGDLVCDAKTQVYDSYGQRDAASRTASGLVRAIDNWIYSSRHPVRFQWRGGKLVGQTDAYRGDFGVAQDDFGRIYANANSSWLHVDLVPAAYFLRHPALQRPAGIYERVVADQSVYSARLNTGVNRGDLPGMLRADGRLAKTTAATWPWIYRGDQFPPDFAGNAFAPEPAGNVVARFSLSRDGIRLKAAQQLTPDADWGQRGFLASTDERFRPVQCFDGPDGALYVVDFYRGIIEYKLFVTPFLNEQIVERKLAEPLGLGRIYRIVHDGGKSKSAPLETFPGKCSSAELVAMLGHPNGWKRDTAQRLLVQRADPAAIPALRTAAAEATSPLGRLHALWTLEGLGRADLPLVLTAMPDPNPQIRAAAARIGDSLGLRGETYVDALLKLAGDSDAAARLQAILSLGGFSEEFRVRRAMAEMLAKDGADVLFRQAAISGLSGREVRFFQDLSDFPQTAGLVAFRRELSRALAATHDPQPVADLLAAIAQPRIPTAIQVSALDGLTQGIGNQRILTLPEKPAALALLAASSSAQVRQRLARLQALLTWPGNPNQPTQIAVAPPLTDAERRRFELGRAIYRESCLPCHQIHGKGMPSLAPPLTGSPWVLEGETRLIRIVLHGLRGPIQVAGAEWNLIMPGQAANPRLTDENLAAVLTYVRREWGHTAAPVEPGTVARIRAESRDRVLPWTVEELDAE